MDMKMRALLCILPAIAACSSGAIELKNEAAASAIDARNAKAAEARDDLFVRPGLVADRTARRITVTAETMSLEYPPEFLLVARESSRDYEAMAVSYAKPSDIHAALEFIGMKPGQPCEPEHMRFWPKGERVTVTATWQNADGKAVAVRAEKLLFDSRLNSHIPEAGWVFTGSKRVHDPSRPGESAYEADTQDPCSIVPAYNAPGTVLDLPRRAAQGAEYGNIALNPEFKPPAGALINFAFEPERPADRPRVLDVALTVRADNAAGAAPVFDIEHAGEPDWKGRGLTTPEAVRIFANLNAAGRDPFVTVRFADDLLLRQVRPVCKLLAAIESENGIRIEPPPEGRLYYRAFIPNEEFRDRNQRMAQPWELRLSSGANGITGKLTQIIEKWPENAVRPELELVHHDAPAPADLKRLLAEHGPGLPVILVFAPGAMTHGAVMEFVRPVLPTHGVVHVFVDDPPAETTPGQTSG
ncbi:MAG: hypothetical protein FJ224_07215 [Lentisphaerae bacterium]|nr:hypothetical protein [Lentisphaerota bacterium]